MKLHADLPHVAERATENKEKKFRRTNAISEYAEYRVSRQVDYWLLLTSN